MDNFSSLVDVLIKDEMVGRPRHEQILLVGDTPQFLVDHANFPKLDLAVSASVISKSCFDHGVSTSLLKRIPDIVVKPKCLFNPADPDHIDSVVVLTYEQKGNNPIIIPIRMNCQSGRSSYFNMITSIYAKEGPDPESKWKNEGLLIHQY